MLSANLWRVVTDRGKRCPLGAPEGGDPRSGGRLVLRSSMYPSLGELRSVLDIEDPRA